MDQLRAGVYTMVKLTTVLSLLATASSAIAAKPSGPVTENTIPGAYIVEFEEGQVWLFCL